MTQNLLINTQYAFKQTSGSTEAQIFFLTEKVVQLSGHLKRHKKDYSSRRGLRKILGTRKRLLSYLLKKDISRYNIIANHLKIRVTKI